MTYISVDPDDGTDLDSITFDKINSKIEYKSEKDYYLLKLTNTTKSIVKTYPGEEQKTDKYYLTTCTPTDDSKGISMVWGTDTDYKIKIYLGNNKIEVFMQDKADNSKPYTEVLIAQTTVVGIGSSLDVKLK